MSSAWCCSFAPASENNRTFFAEQPGIAARIAHLGAGAVVPLQTLNAASLRNAIGIVLQDPSYRRAAQHAADSIKRLQPIAEAVRLIEQVLR